MSASENNIYRVRRTLGNKPAAKVAARGASASKASPSAVAKSKSTASTASKSTPASKPSMSDFIRSQGNTLSAADVVAKGKAAGLKFSDSLVYRVRGPNPAEKAKATASPPKPAVTTAKASAPSKADFVRGLPASMPAREVLAKAKAAGIPLSKTYLYLLRGPAKVGVKPATAKKAGPGPRKAKPTPAKTKAPATLVAPKGRITIGASHVPPAGRAHDRAEELLRAVAAELGLGRAVEILAGERARVRAVLGG